MSASWLPIFETHPSGWEASGSEPPLVRVAAQAVTLTWSWGVEPSEASIVFVVADGEAIDVLPYQEVVLELYGRRFYGVAVTGTISTASRGNTREFRFLDHRVYLDADVVFGIWNQPQARIVNGRWQRRWWHIRPADFLANRRTWTNSPLTVQQVMDDAFGGSTVSVRWTRSYHAALATSVAPSIDAGSGRKLGDILVALSEAANTSFTADGWYRLVWGRLGELDPVVPVNSDDRASGSAVTHAPTKVHVVGGRNLYQVMNMALVPDWNRNWDQYWMPEGDAFALTNFVYFNARAPGSGTTYALMPLPPGEEDRWFAWNAASVRALQITVREMAALVSGVDLRDPKLYGGRPRNEMPAILYLRNVVYRAHRLPATVLGRSRSSFSIGREGPAQIDYDPATGRMTPRFDDSSGAGSGMVVMQGFNFDAQYLAMVRPETLSLDRLAQAGSLWAPVGWSADDNGEDEGQVLYLEQPSVSLHEAIAIVDGLAVFNAARAPLSSSAVRASLCLEGERFAATFGVGPHSTIVTEPALRREIVTDPTTSQSVEVPYADGLLAVETARRLAQPQFSTAATLRHGRYTAKVRPGDFLNPLNTAYSRVVARSGPDGHTVDFEFASHPGRRGYIPEPELDRAYRLRSLLPGQEELRAERRALEVQGRVLAQRPELAREMRRAYAEMVGERGPVEPWLVTGGAGSLNVGTPLWRQPGSVGAGGAISNRNAAMPASTSDTHTEFAGVTVRHGEDAAAVVSVQAGGLMLARVRGPVAVNQALGRSNGVDALAAVEGSSTSVGIALQAVSSGETRLIRVRMMGGAGGGSTVARWG